MRYVSLIALLVGCVLAGLDREVTAEESKNEPEKKPAMIRVPVEFDKATAAKESRAAVDRFIKEWNTGKTENLRNALHYPYVRVGYKGTMHVSLTREKLEIDFTGMRTRQNWDHSTFDKIEPIFVAEDRAHYKVSWSRHNTAGKRYMTGEAVYIVTKRDGRWALSVRSSIWRRREIQDIK